MANKRLNATITIGGAITSGLRAALGTTRDKLQEIGRTVRNLEREHKALGQSIQTYSAMGQNVDALKAKYAALGEQIAKARREQDKLKTATNAMDTARSRMASTGLALGAVTAAASTAFVPVIQAAKFEKAMLGVAKQIDGARDESGKLTQVYFDMARQVQLLGREIPIATNEIADMVAAGARMGVAKDELIGFTRTAAMMASAFDLPAGELAEQMGKIATLFKIPIPNIGELADVINYLDDNAISKGGDIIEVMKRIGGTAQFVKMPAREAAALASTFLTLGSTAEIAATASNAAMRELSIATMQPKRFQAGLQALGLNAAKVQKDMARDATGTILKVLDMLNKLPDEKRLTVATQLFGKEYGDDIAKLAEGVTEYRRQLELARSDKAMGSMAREHQARLQTTFAQWEIAKNRITEVGVNIGTILLPAMNQVLGVFSGATSAVADFVREHQTLVGNVAAGVGTFLGLFAATKAVSFGIAAATFAFNAFKLAMMTNPIGLAAMAIVTAGVLIYRNWDAIREFAVSTWGAITRTVTSAWDTMKNWVGSAASAVSGFVSQHWDTIKAVLSWTPIGVIVSNWEPIRQFMGTLWTGITQLVQLGRDTINSLLQAWQPLQWFQQSWGAVQQFFTNVWADMKATAGQAIDWIVSKIRAVGELWGRTKAFFGFGGAPAATVAATAQAPQPPAPPPVPMAFRGAAAPQQNITDSRQFNFTVNAAPGQDPRAVADAVQRRMREDDGVRRRGFLFDPALGY